MKSLTQKQRIIGGICAAVLVIASVVLGDRAVASRIAAATAVAALARTQEKAAQVHADSALKLAAQLRDSALAAAHAGAIARAKADSAQHSAAQLRGALAQLAKTAPDTCKPIVITADSALAADSATIKSLHAAAQSDSAQIAQKARANDSLTAALTKLQSTSTTLVKADAKLAKAVKTPFLLKILPHPQLSVQEGIDRQGKFHTTLGIGLGYQF